MRKKRRARARPTPRWLVKREDLDEMARRRTLLVLSVLSGERPVTEVIAEAKISRGTYYQLEEKALRAMLVALSPAAGPDGTETSSLDAALSRIGELEAKISRLERDRRRSERLLYVTRKLVTPGPVSGIKGKGGWPKGKPRGRRSTTSGPSPSPSSTTTPTTSPSSSPSTPTTAGAVAR
jgi:hypothetical protein